MPPPTQIKTNSKIYSIPILNGEMDNIAIQIQEKKNEINSLNNHLNGALVDLNNLSNQLLALYIQQTGSFPNQSGGNGQGNGNSDEEDI